MSGETTLQQGEPRVAGVRGLALKCIEGQNEGVVWWLKAGVNTIGRCEDADVRLPDSGISRNHVEIVLGTDDAVDVTDLGSTNGTFVDGRRIDDAARLPVGATLGVGASVVLQLVHAFKKDSPPQLGKLTKRETDVARLVARGMSNAEIAAELGIGKRTVETYLERIYSRLGIKSRVALVRYVLEGT